MFRSNKLKTLKSRKSLDYENCLHNNISYLIGEFFPGPEKLRISTPVIRGKAGITSGGLQTAHYVTSDEI